MVQENPNFNIGSQEELRGSLEALRHRAIEERERERANSQDDSNFVFHVFTFGDPANIPARTVAHLRTSLFSRDVRGSIFEGPEKNAFIVDLGIMTDAQYKQYRFQQAERDQRLSALETSLEDQSLRRLKSQAGSAIRNFPFAFSLFRDLRPEDAVKSADEMLKELTDVAVQAGFEESGPISERTVELDPLRPPHFITEVIFARLTQAIRESISPSEGQPT